MRFRDIVRGGKKGLKPLQERKENIPIDNCTDFLS